MIQPQEVENITVGTDYYFACIRYPTCDSYTIGKTLVFEPLGRLANKALRIERNRSYKHIGILKHKWYMTEEEIYKELSEELKIAIEFMSVVNVGLENCKKITGWAIRKKLQLEYENTKVYTNMSARRNIDGKKKFKRCIIIENIDERRTLVEFDDGYRAISLQVRVTRN